MKSLLVILALFSTNVFALGFGNDNPSSNSTNLNSVSNRIDNETRSAATSFAASNSVASNYASNYSNPTAVTGGSAAGAQSGASTSNVSFAITSPKNTPSVFAGNVYPTSPCMGSSTVGGAGVGFGFSVGSSWTDDECGIRETARSFAGMGMKEDSLAILCTSKYAAAAPSCPKPVAKE
jgi:hypothetical protein